MAKDGKKNKAAKRAKKTEQAANGDGATHAPRVKPSKATKGKKREPTRVDALRSTLTRPATIAAAAGAAVVAGLTGLWRSRR